MKIPAGNEPFTVNVPVYPAGAIYGRVFRPDGRMAENAHASLMIAKKPDIGNRQGASPFGLSDVLGDGVDRGTFNATPLPLDGQYAIVAYEEYSFAMSEAFSLDEKNPIVQTDIHLPQGVDVEGRLLDADGTPVRSSVSLDVSVKRGEHSWGLGCAEIQPDENGRFVFKNVNPGPGGTCSVRVNSRADFRPVSQKIEDLRALLVVRLQKGLRVTGTVIDDATGWSVPGAEVYAACYGSAADYESLEAEGRTNDQGQFVFSNMAQRQYHLNVRSANLANPRQSVIVTGGQSEPVVLQIRIPDGSGLKPSRP